MSKSSESWSNPAANATPPATAAAPVIAAAAVVPKSSESSIVSGISGWFTPGDSWTSSPVPSVSIGVDLSREKSGFLPMAMSGSKSKPKTSIKLSASALSLEKGNINASNSGSRALSIPRIRYDKGLLPPSGVWTVFCCVIWSINQERFFW